jgi:hypothetical protein
VAGADSLLTLGGPASYVVSAWRFLFSGPGYGQGAFIPPWQGEIGTPGAGPGYVPNDLQLQLQGQINFGGVPPPSDPVNYQAPNPAFTPWGGGSGVSSSPPVYVPPPAPPVETPIAPPAPPVFVNPAPPVPYIPPPLSVAPLPTPPLNPAPLPTGGDILDELLSRPRTPQRPETDWERLSKRPRSRPLTDFERLMDRDWKPRGGSVAGTAARVLLGALRGATLIGGLLWPSPIGAENLPEKRGRAPRAPRIGGLPPGAPPLPPVPRPDLRRVPLPRIPSPGPELPPIAVPAPDIRPELPPWNESKPGPSPAPRRPASQSWPWAAILPLLLPSGRLAPQPPASFFSSPKNPFPIRKPPGQSPERKPERKPDSERAPRSSSPPEGSSTPGREPQGGLTPQRKTQPELATPDGPGDCKCYSKPKRKRKSCRNPVVSKTTKTDDDGRLLQVTTREIKCQSSRKSFRSPQAPRRTTSSPAALSSSFASRLL